MPNALTHSYIADEIFKGLPSEVQKTIAPYRRIYDLGCLGPDILMGLIFHSDFDKKNAGERLHTELVRAGLVNGLNYCHTHPQDKKTYAYIMGCLTHYAADSTIHPYVYEYVENRLKQKFDPILNGCLHTIVETEMDVYVGHTLLKGKHANTFWRFRFLPRYLKVAYNYYLNINKDVFAVPLSRKESYLSTYLFAGMALICQRHRNGVVRFSICQQLDKRFKAEHLLLAALRPRGLNPRYDYLNFDRACYPAVYLYDRDDTVNYSFPDMVDLAVERGIKLIESANVQVKTGEEMPLELFFVNYNGQVNIEAYGLADETKFRESEIDPDSYDPTEADDDWSDISDMEAGIEQYADPFVPAEEPTSEDVADAEGEEVADVSDSADTDVDNGAERMPPPAAVPDGVTRDGQTDGTEIES